MGFLPCLRRGTDRWWLPCSLPVTEALGELLLRNVPGQSLAVGTRRRLHRAVLTDPPLMIFASLSWIGEQVEPMQLVDWLVDHLSERLLSGEAYLGEPDISPAIARRWNRLRDHYRTVPFQRWLEDAALWLEVTGPPVPDDWKLQWPQLCVDGELSEQVDSSRPHDNPTPPFHLLQQLARCVQHERSLRSAFDERLHVNKLAALKELAYGLSHEINNPLANISTRAQQLQRGEEDPARIATLQRIVDQVYRAHEMIADLMFYANPPLAIPSPLDVGKLLQEVVDAFRVESERQSIRIRLERGEPTSKINADERMIREAVGALVRNSMEAIGCQGTIVVSLENHSERVEIHVADSGPGLSKQARRHAFDPYFSGREAGRGLGLGLCRAYRITRLHGGEISLAGGPAGCLATIRLLKSMKGSLPETEPQTEPQTEPGIDR